MVCAVYSLRHTQLKRPGVVHLEFSVLHMFVETVAKDTGLSGTVSLWWGGGGGLIATRLSAERTFSDALGVRGVGGVGDRNAVLAGPTTSGVCFTCACTELGVGGNRAGMLGRRSGNGVKLGRPGDLSCLCLRPGVGVCPSMSGLMCAVRG